MYSKFQDKRNWTDELSIKVRPQFEKSVLQQFSLSMPSQTREIENVLVVTYCILCDSKKIVKLNTIQKL